MEGGKEGEEEEVEMKAALTEGPGTETTTRGGRRSSGRRKAAELR